MADMFVIPAAESAKAPATTPENLVERFDAGEDVLGYFDVEHPIVETPETSATRGRQDRQGPGSSCSSGVVLSTASNADSRHPA